MKARISPALRQKQFREFDEQWEKSVDPKYGEEPLAGAEQLGRAVELDHGSQPSDRDQEPQESAGNGIEATRGR